MQHQEQVRLQNVQVDPPAVQEQPGLPGDHQRVEQLPPVKQLESLEAGAEDRVRETLGVVVQ